MVFYYGLLFLLLWSSFSISLFFLKVALQHLFSLTKEDKIY
ncbi:protein of unknown function [Bartonella clarridgeiae 73]|uniref:Uncharacterized protein n=1 Tax=Bartonella clarridgeiae (strain CCUG 45776 / CIP 104772 / 73) TaxID=696125 RepID=E6YJ21_BARC7|nr:MAG: hypothetical protein PG977_001299 [Bartonella clarridgeiae]CBI76859.1 protein of unknown function [Bartonella clarridgeiae 73]